MKLFICLCVFATSMAVFSASQNSQDLSSLLAKIERSAKTNKPIWQLKVKDVNDQSGHYEWRLDKQYVTVSLRSSLSETEASELLKQAMRRVPVAPKSKLTGLGNEAYLYKSDGQDGSMILIRKANVFIQVNSSHLEPAQSFAKDISDLVQSK